MLGSSCPYLCVHPVIAYSDSRNAVELRYSASARDGSALTGVETAPQVVAEPMKVDAIALPNPVETSCAYVRVEHCWTAGWSGKVGSLTRGSDFR